MISMIRGSCLCGQVKFLVNGLVSELVSCHCSECRKAHGAAFATIAVCKLENFSYSAGEELVESFNQSERITRYFCRECGSPLPFKENWDLLVGIPAGLLDDDPGVRPSQHIFVGSKAPWWNITDTIPQHEGWSPESDPSKRTDVTPPGIGK